MTRTRWLDGAVVALTSALGLVLVLTNPGRTDPLWLVWASLALAVCVTSGATFNYGLHRWSELRSSQSGSAALAWIPVSVVAALGVAGVIAPRLLSGADGNWRNGVLLSLGIVAGVPVAAVMNKARLAAGSMGRLGSGDQLADMIALRQLLQRALTVVGWLAAVVMFQAGTLVALEKNLHTALGDRPPQYILLVGGFGSTLIAIVYIPARSALRREATRLCDELFPLRSTTNKVEILDAVEARQKVEQTLGVNGSAAADLQAGLIILSPLIASATASFLPR
jgi:hypothetical protein